MEGGSSEYGLHSLRSAGITSVVQNSNNAILKASQTTWEMEDEYCYRCVRQEKFVQQIESFKLSRTILN